MHRKLIFPVTFFVIISILVLACGEGVQKDKKPADTQQLTSQQNDASGPIITDDQIRITHPINQEWADSGKRIYELKCHACHKLSEEKLVGPGWKGVTKGRTPVWIMNMITNTGYMLDQDTAAQKLLQLCLVRMPNQNLSYDEARRVLEFQRSNDGEK